MRLLLYIIIINQTLHRVATKEREEIKGTTKRKMARRHNKGRNHLEQESTRQKTTEDIDGGIHPAVDGKKLGEGEGYVQTKSEV